MRIDWQTALVLPSSSVSLSESDGPGAVADKTGMAGRPPRLQGVAAFLRFVGALGALLALLLTIRDTGRELSMRHETGVVIGIRGHDFGIGCIVRIASGRELVLNSYTGRNSSTPRCPEGAVRVAYDPSDPLGAAHQPATLFIGDLSMFFFSVALAWFGRDLRRMGT